MGIKTILIDSAVRDVIDEINEKIGSKAILAIHQKSTTGLYLIKLDPQLITISASSDEFRIVRFELNRVRHCEIDSRKFEKVIIV